VKLECQVISLSIAKQLKKLGVKHDSLFYWDSHASEKITGKYGITSDGEYSAYTSAELWEMIPNRICFGHMSYIFKVTKYQYDYQCSMYCLENGDCHIIDCSKKKKYGCVRYVFADTEADALGKMLIFLIKNKLVGA